MSDETALDPEITVQHFAELRGKEGGDAPILLDVREPWEFAAAQISGSLSMPMGDVRSRAYTELVMEVIDRE